MGRRGRKRSPFRIKLRVETVHSLGSLLCFAVALLIMISFSGQGESLQAVNDVLRESFGTSGLLIPFLFITMGFVLTGARWSFAKPQVLLGSFFLFLSSLVLARSGKAGGALYTNFADLLQPLGARTVFALLGLGGFFILTDTSLKELTSWVLSWVELDDKPKAAQLKIREGANARDTSKDNASTEKKEGFILGGLFQKKPTSETTEPTTAQDITPAAETSSESFAVHSAPVAMNNAHGDGPLANSPSDSIVWEYPPLSLLSDKRGKPADRGDVKKNAQIIHDTLESFGIGATVREVNYGPAVTQYAIELNIGTKLTKLTGLANDLALALAAPTGQIRIEAPIPGRSLVGIEVPNRSPEAVSLRTMLTSDAMRATPSKLAVALGLNVAGQEVVGDIGSMPHALIAGATGSGKSVSINAFIASLLFRASPQEVKFIMVDPKRVELTQYNDIPHLLAPVITETKKVISALRWACAEMDNRYKVFAEVGVRNLAGYNQLAGFQAMPYIVIVIDELADIMLFAPNEVEELITRLAQMARAVGIHLLLATQRPSVDVLTGLIKANVPTRLAFNVASSVDSRVILDTPGAEKLLGKGDMLFIPPTEAKPQRIQGTYVSDQEISALIKFIREQGATPEYQEEITTKYTTAQTASSAESEEEQDEVFRRALQVFMESGKASTSYLQRRLSLGYNRAARVIDRMQELGLVSAAQGAKPREVNMTAAQEYLAQHGTNTSNE